MLDVLSIVFPIFALIAVGWLLVRTGVLKPGEARPLSAYVINVALPALLCAAIARRNLSEVVQFDYMLVYMLAGLAAMGLGYGFFRLRGAGLARSATAAMGASCPNSGFIGFPVMMMLFPDAAGVILALNFTIENFVIIPIALILFEASRQGAVHRPAWRIVGDVVVGLLRRPLIWGLLTGLLLSLLQIKLPDVLFHVLDLAGASASPVALISIGVALASFPIVGDRAAAAQIAVIKLVLHPVLSIGLIALLPFLGLDAPQGTMAIALILSTAMPMFSVYPLFASEFGTEGLAAISVVFATLASALTLSLALLWLV